MKRSLIALSVLVLLVTAACASTGTAAATSGVITAVGDNTVTVDANGQATTYNLTSSTYVYNSLGARAKKSFLSNGQRVRVVANGQEAVTISIES
ncbi:MAG TPA: hypothetical protein VE974_04225 [Thermoanaerobaculia bacterium]|nr:hypothetical protein [Thermoanaerobaculia bacterium]